MKQNEALQRHAWRVPARRNARFWYAFAFQIQPPPDNAQTYQSLRVVRIAVDAMGKQ